MAFTKTLLREQASRQFLIQNSGLLDELVIQGKQRATDSATQ
ncbi:hypothetical protein [Xenorhabdus japonica]|nr:hypothetical protein [Xenorhabdus japonica]